MTVALGVGLRTRFAGADGAALAHVRACAGAADRGRAQVVMVGDKRGDPGQLHGVPLLTWLLPTLAAVPTVAALFLAPTWPAGVLAESAATLALLAGAAGTRFVAVVAAGRGAASTQPARARGGRGEQVVRDADNPHGTRAGGADAAVRRLREVGVETWIAAERGRALERAATASGWVANAVYDQDQLRAQLGAVAHVPTRLVRRDVVCLDDHDAAVGVARDVVTSGYRGMTLDHLVAGDPEHCAARVRELADLGFTGVLIRPVQDSAGAAADTVERFLREVPAWL